MSYVNPLSNKPGHIHPPGVTYFSLPCCSLVDLFFTCQPTLHVSPDLHVNEPTEHNSKYLVRIWLSHVPTGSFSSHHDHFKCYCKADPLNETSTEQPAGQRRVWWSTQTCFTVTIQSREVNFIDAKTRTQFTLCGTIFGNILKNRQFVQGFETRPWRQ